MNEKKRNMKLILILVGITAFTACSVGTANGSVLYDDFNDGILDPAWDVEFFNLGTGWTYTESGTELTVTDISSDVVYHSWGSRLDYPWAMALLTQTIQPLADFHVDFNLSWDSGGSNNPIQEVYVKLLDADGAEVVTWGYNDSWIGFGGQMAGWIGEGPLDNGPASYYYQSGRILPYTGSGSLDIDRTGNMVIFSWDGEPAFTGMAGTQISQVQIWFGYFPYSGSFFGSESVDMINVTSEPATPFLFLGDANGDDVVSADDYSSVQSNFGDIGSPGLPGDATFDGVVSADDYASVQTHFGDVVGLPGDANGSGTVSADDYASVQSNFGNTGDPGGGLMGDANRDGVVSADDFASVQAHFGDTAGMGGVPVPEPATLSLLALGSLALLRRRSARA